MVHRIHTGGVRACVLVSYGRSKYQSDETAGRGIVNEKRSMRCAAGFAKLYKLYTGDNLNLYAKKSMCRPPSPHCGRSSITVSGRFKRRPGQ